MLGVDRQIGLYEKKEKKTLNITSYQTQRSLWERSKTKKLKYMKS